MSFKLIAKATVNDCIDVHKYVSDETGLTVVLADVEGPVTNGYFVVVTEAHDDDGLPHTLEHLIFLGSEKYPYKGVLDLLANRCLASGTNAWTDVDHTCYTMTTAGSDGFLELMPIYLDHVLYPKLTDFGYITEVHHISGEGEDAGVVYSEVKGRENTAESIAYLSLIRAAYENSGYSSETGGSTKNLRISTNNKKVREYHAAFYKPENLTIVITGKVEVQRVFDALKPIQEKILSKKKPNDNFTRPWQTPVPPLKESKDIKVLYPTDEEDCGLVYLGYRGPNTIKDYHKITACNLLLRYLTDTSVSPLQKEFVEIDDPYASKVSHSLIENYESLLYLIFDNVPIIKIDLILDKLKEILSKFVNGKEKIDMKRMKTIIEREILESLSNIETDPHDTAAYLIITDVIYGDGNEAFVNRLNMKKQLEYFLNVDEDYWINLLKTYLVEGNYVCIRAYPSIEEQERLLKIELERIENQRNKLGVEGLQCKANELKEAMEQNEMPPPLEVLTKVPVPNSDNINFHYLKIYKSSECKNIGDYVNFSDFPTYAEVYDIHTNFIYISVTLNTDKLDTKLRSYLLLYLELMLESPIRKSDGVLIPYEDVVAALERDTIASAAKLGLETTSAFSCGPFSHTALLMLQVAPEKYEKAVNWCHDLLFSTEFLIERIKVCASKMHNAVPQAKRKPNCVVRDLLKAMYYEEDSNFQLCSMLKQQKFLNTLLKQLDDPDKAQLIINDLNKVREYVTQSKNIAVHIASNLDKMSKNGKNLSKPWKNFIKTANDDKNEKYSLNVISDWKILNFNGIYPEMQGTVVGLGCVESGFLFHAAPSINDFNDKNLPALMLYLQYLTQLEGPLWKLIRGQGYAYAYNIVPRPHEGLLCATLYRATNVIAAFKEMKSAIENHVNKVTDWDNNLLESAKSSLIFEIIERERCVGNLVVQSLLSSFKNVKADYNRILVKKVNGVTLEDLDRVGQEYVAPLFSSKSKTAIVCHPEKVDEIVTAFASMERNLKPVITLEDSILAR